MRQRNVSCSLAPPGQNLNFFAKIIIDLETLYNFAEDAIFSSNPYRPKVNVQILRIGEIVSILNIIYHVVFNNMIQKFLYVSFIFARTLLCQKKNACSKKMKELRYRVVKPKNE